MNTARNIFLGFFLLSIVVIIIGGLFLANLNIARAAPGGAAFYTAWSGARAYAVNALNPYSDIVAQQVQRLVYGRLARLGEPVYRVDLPFHYILLFTPLALISEAAQARAWWMLLSQVALIAFTLMGFSVAQWRVGLPLRAALLLFGLFWVHAVLALLEGSLIVIVALLFAGVLLSLRAQTDELAGFLLAMATIKAEAGILFILYILLWAAVQQRWGVWGGFLMTLMVLGGIAWLFQPDWAWQFARAVFANLQSGPLIGLGLLLETRLPGAGARVSQVLIGLAAAILLTEWYASRNGGYRHMLWTAMLTLSLTPLLGLPAEPTNYVVLLLPLILVCSIMDERWGPFGRWMAIITLLLAFFGLWFIFWGAGGQERALFVPLPLALLGLLYWVRWWAIRPPRTWRDQVATFEERILP